MSVFVELLERGGERPSGACTFHHQVHGQPERTLCGDLYCKYTLDANITTCALHNSCFCVTLPLDEWCS